MAPSTLPRRPTASLSFGWVRGFALYFRYHGVLAPGVRVMRNVSVLGKVLLVSGSFAVPLALIGWFYFQSTYAALDAIDRERACARYVNAVTELMQGVQDERQAILRSALLAQPASLAPLAQEVGRRFEAVRAEQERASTLLGTREAFAELERLHGLVHGQATPDPLQHLALWADYLRALGRLQAVALDGAGGAVETTGHSYYLVTVALDDLPRLSEDLFNLTISGTTALAEDQPSGIGSNGVWRTMGRTAQDWEHASENLRRLGRYDAPLIRHIGADALRERVDRYLRAMQAALEADATTEIAAGLLTEGRDVIAQVWAVQRQAASAYDDALLERERSLRAQAQAALWTIVAGVGISIYMLVAMHNVMRGGLLLLNMQVARMAKGDLSAPPTARGTDEVADALMSLRASLMRLADLFTVVRQHVRGVSHAASKIAEGNANLSARTDQEACAVEAIHVAMEAFSTQLDRCAGQVGDLVPRVQAMRGHTMRSHKNVGRLRSRLAALQGKSREIGEIVELIEGVAAQTKILALNASVEAARVGEAGKGFAVVAEEVRSLAQRSTAAAVQIHDIISSSVEEIDQSNRLAERVAASVESADACAAEVNGGIDGIVTHVSEGQQHARHVMDALAQVREVTEHNADLVEQLSSAASSLREQGAQLSEEVGVFKLG